MPICYDDLMWYLINNTSPSLLTWFLPWFFLSCSVFFFHLARAFFSSPARFLWCHLPSGLDLSTLVDKTIMGAATAHITARQSIDWWWLIRVPNGGFFPVFHGKTSTTNETLQKGKWVGKGKLFQRCHECFFRFEFMKYSASDSSLIKIRSERNENKIRQLYIYILYRHNIYSQCFFHLDIFWHQQTKSCWFRSLEGVWNQTLPVIFDVFTFKILQGLAWAS